MKRQHIANIIANYIYESGVDAEDADDLGLEILDKVEQVMGLTIGFDENGEYSILAVNGQKLCGCKGEF